MYVNTTNKSQSQNKYINININEKRGKIESTD